jgi:hypothetical protein
MFNLRSPNTIAADNGFLFDAHAGKGIHQMNEETLSAAILAEMKVHDFQSRNFLSG